MPVNRTEGLKILLTCTVVRVVADDHIISGGGSYQIGSILTARYGCTDRYAGADGGTVVLTIAGINKTLPCPHAGAGSREGIRCCGAFTGGLYQTTGRVVPFVGIDQGISIIITAGHIDRTDQIVLAFGRAGG